MNDEGPLPKEVETEQQKVLFNALEEIADVMLALRQQADTEAQARRLDCAGEQIIDALITVFSLKSAQIEVLSRETHRLREAWRDCFETVQSGD